MSLRWYEVVILPGWGDLSTLADIPWERQGVGTVFEAVPEAKPLMDRLHIDLAPHTRQDESDVPWTVLGDPEGNEFCVLSSRER